jgi:hypothetical protein
LLFFFNFLIFYIHVDTYSVYQLYIFFVMCNSSSDNYLTFLYPWRYWVWVNMYLLNWPCWRSNVNCSRTSVMQTVKARSIFLPLERAPIWEIHALSIRNTKPNTLCYNNLHIEYVTNIMKVMKTLCQKLFSCGKFYILSMYTLSVEDSCVGNIFVQFNSLLALEHIMTVMLVI